MPHASPHVLGVLNVRGDVLPVVDLRALVGAGEATFSKTTVTILFSVSVCDESRHVGLVVDALSGVRQIPHDLRNKPPEGSDDHIAAIATLADGEMLVILDLDRIVRTFCTTLAVP